MLILHNVSTYIMITGASIILIVGGRSEACGALDDCWSLNVEDHSLKRVSDTVGVTYSITTILLVSKTSNQCMMCCNQQDHGIFGMSGIKLGKGMHVPCITWTPARLVLSS